MDMSRIIQVLTATLPGKRRDRRRFARQRAIILENEPTLDREQQKRHRKRKLQRRARQVTRGINFRKGLWSEERRLQAYWERKGAGRAIP